MLKIVKIDQQIVYKAEVENNNGINDLSTKFNFRNFDFGSFRNRTHENNSELSKFILILKDQNKEFDIQGSILKKSSTFGS